MDEGSVRMQASMYALVAEMNAIQARIEGMKAENQQRESLCQSVAWNDEAFFAQQDKLEKIADRLRYEI